MTQEGDALMIGEPVICHAIRTRSLLTFRYRGLERLVALYCHGLGHRGVEVLRAIQFAGSTRTGGLGFGKLWLVPEMSNIAILSQPFVANDPHYNPNDSAMKFVHCHV